MDSAIIQSGRFTATGGPVAIQLTSGFDYINLYNYSRIVAGPNNGEGVYYRYNVGMPSGGGLVQQFVAAAGAYTWAPIGGGLGFTPFNTTTNALSGQIAVTGINNNTPPRVFTANTSAAAVGNIVRLYHVVGAQQLGSIDFLVGAVNAGVSFDLAFMRSIVNANPGAGFYAAGPFVGNYFYPRRRFVYRISQAANAIVSMTVSHNFTVGQSVRLIVPAAFGMVQANNVQATVVAINAADADGLTNTVTLNLDTTGFNAFAFPLSAAVPFSPALIVPVGEDTGTAEAFGQNILADATMNQGELGVILGFPGPAGYNAGELIYWDATKSSYVSPLGG